MNVQDYVETIIKTLSVWEGVTVEAHRFGGREFKLGKVELGHIHRNGMIDVPFTVAIREYLVEHGLAEHHHLLSDSGWITFYAPSDLNIEHGLWLFRLSYLQKGMRRHAEQDWAQVIHALAPDETLRGILKL